MEQESSKKTCTFFGHRDCPAEVRAALRGTVVELIEQCGADTFYVGNHGAFDAMARSVLRELKQEYSHISCHVVLAYLPQGQNRADDRDGCDLIYPEGIELVPKRFAVSWRNQWMLERSEYVVTYITHGWGGAAQFAQMAKRQKKIVRTLGSI